MVEQLSREIALLSRCLPGVSIAHVSAFYNRIGTLHDQDSRQIEEWFGANSFGSNIVNLIDLVPFIEENSECKGIDSIIENIEKYTAIVMQQCVKTVFASDAQRSAQELARRDEVVQLMNIYKRAEYSRAARLTIYNRERVTNLRNAHALRVLECAIQLMLADDWNVV
jgi:hypothetical protein